MSDTSWTSGPWRVDAPDKVQNLEFIPVVTELGETVCDVCSFFTDDGVPLGITEQVRANARLIAAAPEMAEVLRALLDGCKWKEAHTFSDGTTIPAGWSTTRLPSDKLLTKASAILSALTAADYAVKQGWQPIETAPRDRLVEVYAPSPDPERWTPEVHKLPPVVCLAQWHPDGGFCVCEIREVTHWREHIPPAGEATP